MAMGFDELVTRLQKGGRRRRRVRLCAGRAGCGGAVEARDVPIMT